MLNCWGGIVFPKEYDSSIFFTYDEDEFFESDDDLDNPPMIGFQGKNDGLIQYDDDLEQDFYFSTDIAYKKKFLFGKCWKF